MTLVWTPGFTQWDPASITTALWLDAADASTVTTVSGAVSQWNDKSGNARHAIQPTAGSRPTYLTNTLNGKNVINWGSAINSLALSGSFSGNPARWYGVALWSGGGTFNEYNGLVGFNQANSADVVYGSPGSTSLFSGSLFLNGSTSAVSNVLGTMQNPFIFATNETPTASRTVYNIGYGVSGNRGWRGYIAEVFVTTTILDIILKQKTEGYLAHKWGLTASLPADHPYKVNPPAP